MITNKDAIYQYKHLSDQGQLSSSNGWSDVWVYNELLKYRARLIKQKHEQRIPISDYTYQSTPCLELIEVPRSECICDIEDDCTLLRTRYPVPKTIIPFKAIVNTANNKEYTIVDVSKVRFRSQTRFKGITQKAFAYINDTGTGNHIYLVTNNPLHNRIVGIGAFENPLEVQTYPDCEGKIPFPCREFYDYEFKVDESMYTTIKEMILQINYKLKYGPIDQHNDNIPNT